MSSEPVAPPKPVRSGRRWFILLIAIASLGIGFRARQLYWSRLIGNYRHQCLELKTDRNWEELAKTAEEWSKLEPHASDPWIYRGEAAEGLKEWNALVQYLDRIPRTDPRAVGALVSKAMVEFEKLNRPRDGVKTCDEILEINPRVLVAHKQTVFYYMMTLQRDEGLRRVRRAIRMRRESPETYVFLVSSTWLLPTSLYRNNQVWLESEPESEIFEVARAMPVYTANSKNDPRYADEYQHIPPAVELLEKYPHNPELLAYFLNLAITDGDIDRVQQLLNAYPQDRAASDPRYWRARAWLEDTQGEFDSAEKSLKKAFTLDPYWWQIHFQLNDLLRRLGRGEEAAYYLKIYKISKDLSTEITNLNQSPESLDEKKFCKQLLVLAELIEDDEIVATLRERVGTH
jgi:tetratricopeptide (TPR) repeat protein